MSLLTIIQSESEHAKDLHAALSFYLFLALQLLAATHRKVQDGTKKGKEDNHQDPDDFIISWKIIL